MSTKVSLGVVLRTTSVLGLLLAVAASGACGSKGSDASPSAKAAGSSAPGDQSPKGKECQALKDANDKADEKATLLLVPGVTSYADLAKMANDVEAASKIVAAVPLASADLKAIRDKRKKQFDDFVGAARAKKGNGTVPEKDAEKLRPMSTAINTGSIDTLADVLNACP